MTTANGATARTRATSLYELVCESGPETSVLARVIQPVVTGYTGPGHAHTSGSLSDPGPSKPVVGNVQPSTTRIDSIALGSTSEAPLDRYRCDVLPSDTIVPARKCKHVPLKHRLKHSCPQYGKNSRDLSGLRIMLMDAARSARRERMSPKDKEQLISLLRHEPVYNSRHDLRVALRKELEQIKQAGLLRKPHPTLYCLTRIIIKTLAEQGKVSFRDDADQAVTARGAAPGVASCSTCLPLSPTANSAFENGQSGNHQRQRHKSQTTFVLQPAFIRQTTAAGRPEQKFNRNRSTYPRSQWSVPFVPVSDDMAAPVCMDEVQIKETVCYPINQHATRPKPAPHQPLPHHDSLKQAKAHLNGRAYRQSLVDWITSREVRRKRPMEKPLPPDVTSVSGNICWPDTRPPPPQPLEEQEQPLPPETTSAEELVFFPDTRPPAIVKLTPMEPVPPETRSKRDFFEENAGTTAPLCKLPLRHEGVFTLEVVSKTDVFEEEARFASRPRGRAITSVQKASTASASSYEVLGRAQIAGVLPVRPKTTIRRRPKARVMLPQTVPTKNQEPSRGCEDCLDPKGVSGSPVRSETNVLQPERSQGNRPESRADISKDEANPRKRIGVQMAMSQPMSKAPRRWADV